MDQKFFQKSEYQGLRKLYQHSPRNSQQLNGFNSSDTEIVKIKKNLFLASSTDSVAIEIHSKLYRHPETWGYLAVANSVSDLAASGTKPIGMLVSAQWGPAHTGIIKDKVYRSLSSALKKLGVPLLGGDSGSSHATVLTTTIIGESDLTPLNRIGIRPGDVVILFGQNLGYGPALAFDYLKNGSKRNLETLFRPSPDWRTIYTFRKYFKSSIDTSDGIYNSLVALAELNQVSFVVTLENLKLSKKVLTYKNEFKIPTPYFVESDLGDLQTCIILDSSVYKKIKSKLPFHQVIACAERKSAAPVKYNDTVNRLDYTPLPDLLEQANFDYAKTLNHWLKQHS